MRKITFLKTLLLAIVMMVGSASASAQLLVENFDYPISSVLSTYSPSTGWTVVPTSTVTPIDVTTGLTFSGYAGSGIGGAANVDNTGEDDYKLFTAQTTGTVYAAFIIQTQATNSAGYFFSFTSNTFSSSSYACRVYVNATGNGVGIGPTVPATYQPITAGTPTLLVVKYNITTKASSLFILNSFQSTEPLSANATATETLSTNVGGILLRQYNAAQRIIVDGIRVGTTWAEAVASASSSTISTSTSTLTGFTYNIGSGPSSEQSFTVGGSNLTNDIAINAPTNYEISLVSGGTFGASIPLTQTGGTVATTTIYARLKAGLAVGNYNSENIAITSTGATAASVACSGSVACVASGITFASPTVNKLLSDAAFTVTPTTSSTGAITYSSATPAVASVDASTGLVTLLTAGSTIITASQVADATYCANTATYTLNVAPTTPTITVTENTIADFAANVGSTSQKTANVSGINLTAGITLALSGTNAGLFSLSQSSVAQSGGTAANTVVTITYTPTSSGSHTATLTLSSAGATDVTRTLTATAGLDTPVATSASGANNSTFTANWDAVPGATEYQLNVYTKASGAASATDLFISEYGEGSGGNKKYIEIYNGTGGVVDLANYTIKKATNGAGFLTVYNFPVSTTLANNSTFVLANNNTDVLGATVYDVIANWNGDDAVGLFKNDVLIDVFGTPDVDPGTGWTVAGIANATVDHILIRKSTIISPTTDWTISAGTTTEDSQWTVSGSTYTTTDQTTNLGAHTMSGAGLANTPIAGSPFTVTGATSKQLTGLNGGSTYYYTVIAKDGSVTTPASNEMAASTLTTAIDQTNSALAISAVNGKIVLRAVAGETINVYNAIGQKILSKSSIDGLNTFAVAAHGVVMVKVGNRVGKVIL